MEPSPLRTSDKAVDLTLAAVEALYGEDHASLERSPLARWHLYIAEALIAEKRLPEPSNHTDVWHVTERLVARHYRHACGEIDDDTVRMTAVLHKDFVHKCIELLAPARTPEPAE